MYSTVPYLYSTGKEIEKWYLQAGSYLKKDKNSMKKLENLFLMLLKGLFLLKITTDRKEDELKYVIYASMEDLVLMTCAILARIKLIMNVLSLNMPTESV